SVDCRRACQRNHRGRIDRFAIGFRPVSAPPENRKEASTASAHGVDRMSDCRRSFLSGDHGKTRWSSADAASCQSAGVHRSTERCSAKFHFYKDIAQTFMISLSRIGKQYGRQILFVDASFQLNPGEKVGLVGPNGSGKTTLFRMIIGEESPDD